MPDKELAALLRGETKPRSKTKVCPYCSLTILALAPRCKHCDGDQAAKRVADNAWRTLPASEGQLSLLRLNNVKFKRKKLTMGKASDLLHKIRDEDGIKTGSAKKGGTGAGQLVANVFRRAAALAVTFLIGVAIHHFRAWETIPALLKGKPDNNAVVTDEEIPSPRKPTTAERAADTMAIRETRDAPDARFDNTEETIQSDTEPVQYPTEESKYASRFKEPTTGSMINLTLTNDKDLSGHLVRITAESVTVERNGGIVTVPRNKLAARSRARCYQDDYVRIMEVLEQNQQRQYEVAQRKNEEWKQSQQAASERKLITAKSTPKTTTTDRTPTANSKSGSAMRPDLGNMSMKEWMDKYNTDNELLRARQQRVHKYERNRHREDRVD